MSIRLSDGVPLTPLAARVEEVCLNAWPALHEIHYDGWLIRLADGQTRRTNSVNAVGAGSHPLEEKIAYCEEVYRRHHLPACFRLLSNAGRELEDLLVTRGYRSEGETSTLFMQFAEHPPVVSPGDIELTRFATNEWMRARTGFLGLREDERAKIEKILQQLALPAVFAALRDERGTIRSIAKGAVHDGIVCLNMVASDPGHLRRGHSRACLAAILRWAIDEFDATGACLQVLSDNAPAVRLYNALGFDRELYRYHYRILAPEFCS
jgi:GNAT superfamily N-acetyltransferase